MKITVNGREYDSWDEVPEAERALLQRALPDQNHDGVPDVFQGGALEGIHTTRAVEYQVDGRTYHSLDEIPEPMRSAMRQAGLDADTPPQGAPPVIPMPTPASGATLNGEPFDPNRPAKKKHWWQRG